MEEKFKFFADKYNKILDLIEIADVKLAKKYKEVLSIMPDAVINKLKNEDEFKGFAKDFQANLGFEDEMLEFDYTQYNKYLDVAIRMYPLYEEEFSDEFDDEIEEEFDIDFGDMNQWFIFSLTYSNVKGVAKLRFDYELKDGKLEHVKTEMNGVEIDYQVFVEKRDDKFFIMTTKYLNGNEIYKKETPISYDDLLLYSATWDDIDTADEEYEVD